MKKFLLGLGMLLLPVAAFAQNNGGPDLGSVASNTQGGIVRLTILINSVIPFLLAIAVVVFIYGVIKYLIASSPDDKAAGRSYIIWGIIGIAVILSIFGLVKLLQNTFGVGNTTLLPRDIPSVPPTN